MHLKNIDNINTLTKIYGIIGNPVNHSLSPKFWNKIFYKNKFNAVYLAFCVNVQNFNEAVTGLSVLGAKGVNITAPFKEQAKLTCNKLHYPANIIGVVNTIKFSNNFSEGFNTDSTGFLKILESLKLSSHHSALILGNGCTARSIIWALNSYGIKKIEVIARTKKQFFDTYVTNNYKVAYKFNFWSDNQLQQSIKNNRLIINCTPLNREKNQKIENLEKYLKTDDIYIDLNYSNYIDGLTDMLQNNGVTAVNGLELLAHQGQESIKILTGLNISAYEIKKIIL